MMLIQFLWLIGAVLLTCGSAKAYETRFEVGFNTLVNKVTNQPYLSPQINFENAIAMLKNQPKIAYESLRQQL